MGPYQRIISFFQYWLVKLFDDAIKCQRIRRSLQRCVVCMAIVIIYFQINQIYQVNRMQIRYLMDDVIVVGSAAVTGVAKRRFPLS